MAINLSIRWNHPGANQAMVRYARIDNVSNPVYTLVTPNLVVSQNTSTVSVATNVPNGQYVVEATAIYPDGRPCTKHIDYTPACPGLIAIDAHVNGSNIVVEWTAPSSIPKARISISWVSGGTYVGLFSNVSSVNTSTIPIPSGVITMANNSDTKNVGVVRGQSVCDESSGFYSAYSDSISVSMSSSSSTNPVMGNYKVNNNVSGICNSGIIQLYTDGVVDVDKVLYLDYNLTQPFTGYSYVEDVVSKIIYSTNPANGNIEGETGQYCNVAIHNHITANNFKILGVTGISGFVLPGGGVVGGSSYYGTRSAGLGIYGPTVNVVATGGASGSVKISKNGVLVECIDLSGDGTYTFGTHSYAPTDLIEIETQTSAC